MNRAIAILIVFVCGPTAFADRLQFNDGAEHRGVRVVNVAEGDIFFQVDGARQRRPLAELTDAHVDDLPSLENLERLMAGGRFRQAAEGYERLRDRVSATWQRRLVEARLVRARDAEGRLDLAVERFVQLMLDMGAGAAGLAPQNLPSPGSRFYATALGAIDRGVVANHLNDETRAALRRYAETLRLAEAGAASGPPAKPAETKPAQPEDSTPVAQPGQPSALEQARAELAAGRHRQAGQLAEIAAKSAAGDERTECIYISGAAQLALARSRQAKLDAGLTLMEVVSRDARSPFAAAALWQVGMLYEELGRTAKAKELYRESRDHPAASDEVRKAVVDALARIDAAGRD